MAALAFTTAPEPFDPLKFLQSNRPKATAANLGSSADLSPSNVYATNIATLTYRGQLYYGVTAADFQFTMNGFETDKSPLGKYNLHSSATVSVDRVVQGGPKKSDGVVTLFTVKATNGSCSFKWGHTGHEMSEHKIKGGQTFTAPAFAMFPDETVLVVERGQQVQVTAKAWSVSNL